MPIIKLSGELVVRLKEIFDIREEPINLSDLMKTKKFHSSAVRCINPGCGKKRVRWKNTSL
jgi:hypothetical protein